MNMSLPQSGGTADTLWSAAPGPVSGFYKVLKSGAGVGTDGRDAGHLAADLSSLTAEATNFTMSLASTAGAIATDPLGWLINQGLGFLMTVVKPIKDAIDFVSGNPEELSKAAGQFNNLAKEIESFSSDLLKTFDAELSDWEGEAAAAAKSRLAEFAHGVSGAADKAGDIAGLLQISSIVCKVIEDFIKGLLTELIEWLIVTWLAALASAPVTAGASTAAAGGVTAVKTAATVAKTSEKVTKFGKLLNKIRELLQKLQRFLKESSMGRKFMDSTSGKGGKALKKAQDHASDKAWKESSSVGPMTRESWQAARDEAGSSFSNMAGHGLSTAAQDAVKNQRDKLIGWEKTKFKAGEGQEDIRVVPADVAKTVGKVVDYGKKGVKAGEFASTGEDQSGSQIRSRLELSEES
ncbi:hypothetical protein D5S17_14310 [Pseudonocardiaceae bacterium YIM PH 21723]|nr:hypothetical protein D5S17_14310 [Pseudonocardiaceae bacterium YIM PH 21723]